MRKKLIVRIAASLGLTAVLFLLPVMSFMSNKQAVLPVYAGDGNEGEERADKTETGSEKSGSGDAQAEDEMLEVGTGKPGVDGNDSTGDSKIGSTDSSAVNGSTKETGEDTTESGGLGSGTDKTETGSGTSSSEAGNTGSGTGMADPIITDEEKDPIVMITFQIPTGWHAVGNTQKVSFSVTDIAFSGKLQIKEVKAKIGQNGSYTDVTDEMELEISENCVIYVQVIDASGKAYEKNKYIKCFDNTKPTLNAAVSEGLLSIQSRDYESGVKVIYVNGYEFTELTDGMLNIRLSQFDAGYEYFTITAMDNAGNMSETYKTKNPYYKDEESEDDEDPAKELPVNASATPPTSATAQVIEHTGGTGATTATKKEETGSSNSLENQKKAELKKAAEEEEALKEEGNQKTEETEAGKEFYTIQAASGKVFYLIIDKESDEQTVYFLTEISENDLLNVTTDNSETLPKNSAALESQIPVEESALPNNNKDQADDDVMTEVAPTDKSGEDATEPEDEKKGEDMKEKSSGNKLMTYLFMGVIALVAIGAGYYFKVVKKKQEGEFVEDEDEEDDDEYDEAEEDEDEEDADEGDDLFMTGGAGDKSHQSESEVNTANPSQTFSEEDVTETIDDDEDEE